MIAGPSIQILRFYLDPSDTIIDLKLLASHPCHPSLISLD
jgi:hypothetical protein